MTNDRTQDAKSFNKVIFDSADGRLRVRLTTGEVFEGICSPFSEDSDHIRLNLDATERETAHSIFIRYEAIITFEHIFPTPPAPAEHPPGGRDASGRPVVKIGHRR